MDERVNTSESETAGSQSDGGFIPSDLPHLPPDQLKLLRYIMRKSGITHSKLRADMEQLPSEDAVGLDRLDAALAELLHAGHILRQEQGTEITYRAQIRRKARSRTMQGIWEALGADPDTGISPEMAIHPELRKVRSELANRMLAKLDAPLSSSAPAPASDGAARSAAQTLLDDLVSAAKASMEKRTAQAQPSQEPSRGGRLDVVLDDLIKAAPHANAENPDPSGGDVRSSSAATDTLAQAPKEKGSILSRLVAWLGLKSKSD